MRTIASLSGVSVMTVSRALRNDRTVKPKTCERIHAIARRLGYVPNPLVSALMTQRRTRQQSHSVTTLALIHCLPWGSSFTENMLTFHQAVRDQASSLGFEVESFHLHEPGMTLDRLMNIIRSRGIRGIIWEHFFSANNRLNYDFSDFACVSISNSLIEPAFDQIESDRFAEMRLALQHLGELGYRRIGYCSIRHVEVTLNFKRLCALLLDQSFRDASERVPWLEVEKFEDYEDRVTEWLHRHRPQVVMSQNPHTIGYIKRAGFQVPEEVGFLHLGHHPTFTDMAGIDPNWAKRGAVAVDRLVELLNRNQFGVPSSPTITYVGHRWSDGPSLRRVGPPMPPATTRIAGEQPLGHASGGNEA